MPRKGFAPIAILLIIGGLLAIGGGYFLLESYTATQQVGSGNIPATASAQIWAVADFINNPISITGRSFISSSTKTIVSFNQDIKDNGGPYGEVDVYVNGKVVGVAQTALQSLLSFSTNNKYFAYRTQHSYGMGSFDYTLSVINLGSNTMTQINAPYLEPRNYPKSKINPKIKDLGYLNGIIESYSWNEDAINVIFYFVTAEHNTSTNSYYRVSPKELWNYNLNTKSYTFVRNLPE